MREELLVPGDGGLQALLERKQRLPAEQPAGLGGAQILLPNLVARLVANLRLEVRVEQLQDALHKVEDGDLCFVGEVEGLAAPGRVVGKFLGQQEIGRRSVLDIE